MTMVELVLGLNACNRMPPNQTRPRPKFCFKICHRHDLLIYLWWICKCIPKLLFDNEPLPFSAFTFHIYQNSNIQFLAAISTLYLPWSVRQTLMVVVSEPYRPYQTIHKVDQNKPNKNNPTTNQPKPTETS